MPDATREELPLTTAPVERRPGRAVAAIRRWLRRRADRFMSPGMAIAFLLYAAFALTFSAFQVKGDAAVYFNLLRRFFGERPDFAFAYQFGSAVWNTPFFLVGKLVGTIFGFQPRNFHVSFQELSITLATNVAFVVILYLGWLILKELGLPRGPAVLFLTVFGTPLFYYVVFEPAGKHVVDTLVLTAAVYVFLRCTSNDAIRPAVALGALCGWSINIRWVNVAFFAVLAIALVLLGRERLARFGSVAAVAVACAIFLLPATRGIDYFFPLISQNTPFRVAAPAPGGELLGVTLPGEGSVLFFDPTIPAKMLFSDHRGLFLWTPLTALAVAGFILALLRARSTKSHLSFYLTMLAASLALLFSHTIWEHWDGGFAFSQRFLTGLFPLYLIGTAELVRRLRWGAYPALVAAAAFAVAVAFVHDIGYDGISERDGLSEHVQAGWDNRRNMRLDVQDDAKQRWEYVWGLFHGRDTSCIHEPPGTEC